MSVSIAAHPARTRPGQPGDWSPRTIPEADRLYRIGYACRLFLFYVNGAAWPLLLGSHVFSGSLVWAIWVGLHALWPHVAYLHGRLSRDRERAGRLNAVLDLALLGILANEIHYVVWFCFASISGMLINCALRGGMRQVGTGLAVGLAATLGWGLFNGFAYLELDPARIELAGALIGALPLLVVMYFASRFVRALRRAGAAIENKNRIFEALIQMGVATHRTGEVEPLLRMSLRRMRAIMPECDFGVVLREPGRPRLVRHTCFLGMDSGERTRLVKWLRGETAIRECRLPAGAGGTGSSGQILPMAAHLSTLEGFLIVRGAAGDPDTQTALRLFSDQLGSSLQSTLLTGELQRLADTDPLTGLYNRSFYRREFELAVRNREGAAEAQFSLVAIDLNGFKAVNDEYGHAVGDSVLVEVSARLRQATRDSDVLIRMGGDEFLVLCHMCGTDCTARVTERIRAAFRDGPLQCRLPNGDSLAVPISLSIGAASSEEIDPEHLLQMADSRMYTDKRRHREACESSARPAGWY